MCQDLDPGSTEEPGAGTQAAQLPGLARPPFSKRIPAADGFLCSSWGQAPAGHFLLVFIQLSHRDLHQPLRYKMKTMESVQRTVKLAQPSGKYIFWESGMGCYNVPQSRGCPLAG